MPVFEIDLISNKPPQYGIILEHISKKYNWNDVDDGVKWTIVD